jgi:hypothetical protein
MLLSCYCIASLFLCNLISPPTLFLNYTRYLCSWVTASLYVSRPSLNIQFTWNSPFTLRAVLFNIFHTQLTYHTAIGWIVDIGFGNVTQSSGNTFTVKMLQYLTSPVVFLSLWTGKIPDRWIGIGEIIPWSPPPPSFSRFDFSAEFFFWGLSVKDTVYGEKVPNMNELRDRIVRAAECVTNEILASTWRETEYRLHVSWL